MVQISSLHASLKESSEQKAKLETEITEKTAEVQKANEELAKMKTNVNEPNSTTSKLRQELKKRTEEYELVKQLVVDRDKTIKKLQDNHNKDISHLRLEKEASADALNRVTEENTLLKDKENTLLDVFKYMKVFMDSQTKRSDNDPTDLHCNECNEVFTSHELLVSHMRGHSSKKDSGNVNRSTLKEVQFSCDECDYTNSDEENVLNHTIATHSKHPCDKCKFIAQSISELVNHSVEKHANQGPRFDHHCWHCNTMFTSREHLNSHINTHHRPERFCCDYCGLKFESFATLDNHIQHFHKITSQQATANFVRPRSVQIATPSSRQRLENGYCKSWNEGHCRYNAQCKYAHVKPCKFQERCRSKEDCQFYHTSKDNISFLCGLLATSKKPFLFNHQEFPPLMRSQRNIQRRQ